MANSIRLNCLLQMQADLQAMGPASPNGSLAFEQVELGPIDPPTAGRFRAFAGIVPGHETKRYETTVVYCTLPVAIEFHAVWQSSDEVSPQQLGEQILTSIQTTIENDITLGGYSIDCKEISNEITLKLFSSRQISGVAHFDILYRHSQWDPTQPC